MNNDTNSARPFDPHRLLPAVEYLAQVHATEVNAQAFQDALRRIGDPSRATAGTTPARLLATLAAEAGLATATVRRPVADVLADASPSYPWLAFHHTTDGRLETIAVLEHGRRGVKVVVPGSTARPVRWPVASLLEWLRVADTSATVEWLLAEPAAPLSRLRTTPGMARVGPDKRLRALLVGERQTLWVAVVYSVVIGLLSLVVPIAVQSVVNTIAFGSVIQPLVVLTLFVLVALGFSTALNTLRASVVEIVQRSIFARVSTDVTYRLLRVRADAFDRYHGPELVNRFFDTVTVQKSASLLLIDGLSIVMQTAIGMLLLAVYHPWLAVFDVLLVLAMLVIVFALGRGAVTTAITESKAKYALEGWLEQLATHLVTFKSAGGTTYATARAHHLLEQYLDYRSRHFSILIRQIIGSFALQAVASAALLGIGGWLVIERQLTLGQLVASELIVSAMVSAFTKFGKQLEVFYDLSAALDKLGDLIDLPLERGGGEATLPGTGPASLEIQDVQVSYDDDSPPALRLAHLSVPAGGRVGITGPNGSGKSTLADTIFGMRPPARGVLRIDGADQRTLSLRTLREHVALVRSIELFPGSIVDNVRLGRAAISMDDVSAALDAVGLLTDVLALPEGIHTTIQPHGRPLSQGQARRLMIARAIVGRPRLLVLDGALDQIDGPGERERLGDLLFDPAAPWTLLCLTEQPDVLSRCARVVTMRDGTCVDLTMTEKELES